MLSGLIVQIRVGWWITVILAGLFLAAACGGPENQESDNQEQSSSGVGSGQEPGQLDVNNGSTTRRQSDQGVAGSGGQSSQVSTAGEPPPAVALTDTAARINEDLEPALEQALGTDLVVTDA